MRVIIVVRMHVAMPCTEGVFEFVAAVYSFVYQPFFFKCSQRSIEGDAVCFGYLRFNIAVRKGVVVPQKNIKDFFPKLGFSQVVGIEQFYRRHHQLVICAGKYTGLAALFTPS